MKHRILLSKFLILLFLSACSQSKHLTISEQTLAPLDEIENYTSPALIEAGNCDQTLTNTTFLKIIDKLEEETIEVSRLEMARKILEVYCYTSNQIVRMMEIFNFEKNKLSVAQLAYTSCYDQENYFIVLRDLQLGQSKTTLQNYMDSVK